MNDREIRRYDMADRVQTFGNDHTTYNLARMNMVDHATVAGKDYNLSVGTYVEAKDNREVVDIGQLNAELVSTVAKIERLRADIDAIVAEIEGGEA